MYIYTYVYPYTFTPCFWSFCPPAHDAGPPGVQVDQLQQH